MGRICIYCGSEMDLMEEEINAYTYVCVKEDCNSTCFVRENYDDEWENMVMNYKIKLK